MRRSLDRRQARAFCDRWLPAWTGNKPEELIEFYADEAFYLDPGTPEGVVGKPALLEYFRKLLARNPDWEWTHVEGIPMEDGFLNRWHAHIPVGQTAAEIAGVCLVQLDDDGKIYRNEVYFDRSMLLELIERERN